METKGRILSQRFFLVRWRSNETYEVFDHANDEWIACEWKEDIGTHIGAMLRAKPPKRARAGTDARGAEERRG